MTRAISLDIPTIVCLCGSTRFFEQFMEANYRETMKGHIVLSVGFFMHRPETTGIKVEITPEQKLELDELHLKKIDLADEVLILNVGGYLGASTKREAWYAHHQGKVIRLLEPNEAVLKSLGSYFATLEEWEAARHLAAHG